MLEDTLQDTKPEETADPLPSWNDNNVKRPLLNFVTRVSTEGAAEFVPPGERIAVFDNDGTLLCERPFQVQLLFALDRLDWLAADKTEMRKQQPFKAFLERDLKTIATFGKREAPCWRLWLHCCEHVRGDVQRLPDDPEAEHLHDRNALKMMQSAGGAS